MVCGRFTRFCFPFTKMVMNSARRRRFALFWAAVSLRLGFDMTRNVLMFLKTSGVSCRRQPVKLQRIAGSLGIRLSECPEPVEGRLRAFA